jgi:hypothetical protein
MAEVSRLFVAEVVREVSPIPDDHVGAVDCFAGEPRIQPGLIWRSGRNNAGKRLCFNQILC